MKTQGITLKHLIKFTGKSCDPLASPVPAIYFDGRSAIAAIDGTTIAIDCPQEISLPMLIATKDLKTAMIADQNVRIHPDDGGHVRINGIRAMPIPCDEIPEATRELIDLDRQVWHPVVRPVRVDGGRLSQVLPAVSGSDPRIHLTGVMLDFATGAIVGVDGRRMHVVEEALPICEIPDTRVQALIMPAFPASVLATFGGLQDLFVMQKRLPEGGDRAFKRLICIAAAGARFRIREIETLTVAQYRPIFEHHRALPINLVWDAATIREVLTVTSIAGASMAEFGNIVLEGDGRQVTASFLDRVSRTLPTRLRSGERFRVQLPAGQLADALKAASSFGAAVRFRCDAEEESTAIYVGAQDFHAIVAVVVSQDEQEGQGNVPVPETTES